MGDSSNLRKVKLEHFKNLVAVAYADGIFEQDELDFLSEKAQEYGLTDQQVKDVMDQAATLQFVVPLNQIDKDEQLTDVIYMSMIDGQVHEKEYTLCLAIAERLDFEKTYLDQAIALIAKLNAMG